MLSARITPSERKLFVLVIFTLIASVLTSIFFEQAVNWVGFIPGIAPGAALVALGLYLRQQDQRPRTADFLVSTGIYVLFGAFMAIFIFCFFPILRPTVDAQLFRLDALIGYDWTRAVAWAASMPVLGKLMGLTYHSSLWQVIATLGVLAAMNQPARMHHFLMAGFVALILTLGIWVMFPSFGPAAYLTVPDAQTQAIGLIVNPAYGATLMDYAANGIPEIGPRTIIGAIAFPSFHTVMLCLILWFCRNTPAFWPMVAVNILMIPAILIHGGHHVTDVMGGIVTSVASVWIARLMLAEKFDLRMAKVSAG